MATPRPNLKDLRRRSATPSNSTLVGHKEIEIVKRVSEGLASRLKTNLVLTAGAHWNSITPEGIHVGKAPVDKLIDRIPNED